MREISFLFPVFNCCGHIARILLLARDYIAPLGILCTHPETLIMHMVSNNQRAYMLGLYSLIHDASLSVAPCSAALFWNISPATNFLVAIVFGILGHCISRFMGKTTNNIRSGLVFRMAYRSGQYLPPPLLTQLCKRFPNRNSSKLANLVAAGNLRCIESA